MWFFRQTGLRQQELGTGSKLECAIEEARNLSLFQRSYYLQLLNADPRWMSAVSSGARVRWKRIERRNREILLPIADGLAAAHQKRISKGKLASKIGYVLKAPKKAYRLYKYEQVTADGEIVPKFKQKKDDLRPGERLTLFRLLQDMNLDHLALGGGEGAEILRRVKRRVSQDLAS